MLLEFLKNKKKYIVFFIFLIILYLSFLIVKPFINTLLLSVVLVYLFYPIYKRLLKRIKNKTATSIISTVLIILIVLIPFLFAIRSISIDALNLYQTVSIDEVINTFKEFLGNNPELFGYITTVAKAASGFILNIFSNLIKNIPIILLNSIVLIFSTFYLFKEGENLIKKIKNSKIFDKKQMEEIIKRTNGTFKAIIHGSLLTGIIEGFLVALSFLIFGIPNPVFWGLIAVLLVMLPGIGATLLWVPAAIWLLYKGKIVSAILMAAFNALLVSGLVESSVRPKFIGKRTNLHPLTVLIGILGGIQVFGFIGIITGPIILSLLTILYKAYVD